AKLSLLLYVGLGLFFANTYYFVYSGEIPTIHFERNLLQVWPLIALSVAGTFDLLLDRSGRCFSPGEHSLKRLAGCGTAIVCGFLVLAGCRRRVEASQDELRSRIAPLTSVLENLAPR